jgi:hypothetical protein
VCLIYQDAYRIRSFTRSKIRTVEVPDLGTLLSVTLVTTVDTGNVTFTLVLPHVRLPAERNASTAIETESLTTVHRAFVGLIGHSQRETYTDIHLSGNAVNGFCRCRAGRAACRAPKSRILGAMTSAPRARRPLRAKEPLGVTGGALLHPGLKRPVSI